MKRLISIILALSMLLGLCVFSVGAAEEDVARMWLCAQKSHTSAFGHIFLLFENLSDETITVGRYKLEPGDWVSVGSFGSEGIRGYGVYYNLETRLDQYYAQIGISTLLDEGELRSVTDAIRNRDSWNIFNNCYSFAVKGWNAGAESSFPYLIFPAFARMIMNLRGSSSIPVDIINAEKPIYKQSEL